MATEWCRSGHVGSATLEQRQGLQASSQDGFDRGDSNVAVRGCVLYTPAVDSEPTLEASAVRPGPRARRVPCPASCSPSDRWYCSC